MADDDQKVFAETFPLTREDIAAMLALIGKMKEDETGMTPTAKIMFDRLQYNLKLTFDKLEHYNKDFATVRVDSGNQLGDTWWEYAKIPKNGKYSKLQAIAAIINRTQEAAGNKRVSVEMTDETSTDFEMLLRVVQYLD